MHVKYKVTLTEEERVSLEKLTSQGKSAARKIKRSQILLMGNEGIYNDQDIAEMLTVNVSTVYRVKRDFVEYGLEEALEEGARCGQPRKLTAQEDALLVAIACTNPPAGRCRWTRLTLRAWSIS